MPRKNQPTGKINLPPMRDENVPDSSIEEELERVLNMKNEPKYTPVDKKLHAAARSHVMQKTFREYYKYLMDEDPTQVFDTPEQQRVYDYVQAKKDAQIKEYKSTHIFITINPKPDIDFNTFRSRVEKVIKKKWIKVFNYCFEQRGETEATLGQGFHCHLQVNRPSDKVPAHCTREIYNTFKDLVGNTKAIDFSFRKDPAPGYKYIIGEKKDISKTPKMEMDKLWRKQQLLEPYYSGEKLQV